MHKKLFWVHLPEIFLLGSSPCMRETFQISQVLIVKFSLKSGAVCDNLTNGWQIMSKKLFWTYLHPNLCTRSKSPCETIFSNKKVCQVLIIKFWLKWGVVCENLTSGCYVMSEKPFLAHSPQIYMLGLSSHTRSQPPQWSHFTHTSYWVLVIKFWIK